MIGGVSDDEVVRAIQEWVPSNAYRHERKFQSELQDYLDESLNSGVGLLDSGGGGVEVSTERGKSRADLAVNDTIGIEMKRNLSNSQTKKLKGEIDDQREEYESVIVVACGIDDMDGWRRVPNKIQRDSIGLQAPVHFVHKLRDEYGSDSGGRNEGGRGARLLMDLVDLLISVIVLLVGIYVIGKLLEILFNVPVAF